MHEGIVKFFNKKKNYGFIAASDQEEIFFHSTSITDPGFFELAKSDRVTFEIRDTRHGRQAVNVRVVR
jgi:CspA family cold shock protein